MVPQEWKKALVIPIYKKGNTKLASKYRPVSLKLHAKSTKLAKIEVSNTQLSV